MNNIVESQLKRIQNIIDLKKSILSCIGEQIPKTCGLEFDYSKFKQICEDNKIVLSDSFEYLLFRKEKWSDFPECFKNSDVLIMDIIKDKIIEKFNEFLVRFTDVSEHVVIARNEEIGKSAKVRFLAKTDQEKERKDLRGGDIINIVRSNDSHLYPFNSIYYHIKMEDGSIWSCGDRGLQPEVLITKSA